MDIDLEPVMRDALTKGDPKLVLSILLTVVVMALREGAFAKVQLKGRLGDGLRWLGTTHWGGVISSMLGSAIGAVITALSTKTMPSAGVLLNTIFIAAAASGVSTWMKWHKQNEDKRTKNGNTPPASPPSSGASLLLILSASALFSGCATLKDGLVGFKGEAAFALTTATQETLKWDRTEQMRIASSAPTRAEGEEQLRVHRAKRDEILKGYETVADALQVLHNALVAANATQARDWLKLAMAIVDAFQAVKDTLTRYGVPIPIPDVALPKQVQGGR